MHQRKISFVIMPGFEMLDLAGPLSAFYMAREMFKVPYLTETISAEGGLIFSETGLAAESIRPDPSQHYDTIIVIGGAVAHLPGNSPETVTLLRQIAQNTSRIASVCTGAFHLAEAGILDGCRATTHWRYAPNLQARFPSLRVDADKIFINDGNIWTSAGITAGIDMALALIEADAGFDLSRSVARELVVYHRRRGGQSQFSELLNMDAGSDRIRATLAFAREHLHEDLSLERLAGIACLSSRQYSRVFLKEIGETPARAVERLRADAARPQLEAGIEPIEVIARQVGFGNAERMRRSFIRLFGQNPQALRRTARAS
ncbi:AraC family transcriptional regulator [Kaistia sp. 32K]|uniref:GlxA family transcriptional regulator n=1 Tax=Kaistia sp. 32K TaxID=2795690 RepID=UPI00191631C9|nr:GlxA family transcriptional regulator [Kaistia sp. 32K]BCP53806.1 AraC family transcriptional regulator [Kaistia sp. 32K]